MEYYPAVRDTGSIDLLLAHIRQTPPPPAADVSYLKDAGFRREGDEALADLLLFLGFVDADWRPEPLWKTYAGDRSGRLLSESVRRAYSHLFESFGDPGRQSDDDLMTFFRKQTSASETDLAFMVLTFRVLRDVAGPDPAAAPSSPQPSPVSSAAPAARAPSPQASQPAAPAVQAAPAAAASKPAVKVERVEGSDARIRISLEMDVSSDPELVSIIKALLEKAGKA